MAILTTAKGLPYMDGAEPLASVASVTQQLAEAAGTKLVAAGVFTGVADGTGRFTVTHNLGVNPICSANPFGAGGATRTISIISTTSTQATFQINNSGVLEAGSTQDVHWICVAP